jgi:hypothetical protein
MVLSTGFALLQTWKSQKKREKRAISVALVVFTEKASS